jgi:hypothetical protein
MLMWNSVLQLFSVIALLILNGVAFSTKKLDTGFVVFFTLGPQFVLHAVPWGGIL